MKYAVKFTNQFKKDLKLAKKQGKAIERLYAVIEKLADDEPLYDLGMTWGRFVRHALLFNASSTIILPNPNTRLN